MKWVEEFGALTPREEQLLLALKQQLRDNAKLLRQVSSLRSRIEQQDELINHQREALMDKA